jgi:hypothetical protein
VPSKKAKKINELRLPSSPPVVHWEALFPGDRIEVWTDPYNSFHGTVSDSTEDGRIIWVFEDGIGIREMLHRDDHPTVYRAQ